MTSRILVSIGIVALWTLIFTALDGDVAAFAAYARELQVNSSYADTAMQYLMNDHVRLPSVLSMMMLAVLWAPVLDANLAAKGK